MAGFKAAFGTDAPPTALGVAPGRAEVLGNHTDYNEGYILSCAIDRYVVLAGHRLDSKDCKVASSSFPGHVVGCTTDQQVPSKDKNTSWANYVFGVISELKAAGVAIGGFQAYLTSNVPLGAGVSSSAAVEMATAKLLARLYPETVGKLGDIQLVTIAKKAENNYVGMGCGILDQFSSGMGKAGSLLFLDCRTLNYGYAPFRKAVFVLANTHAPHQLVDGKYNELRACCFAAAEALKKLTGRDDVMHLRDVSSSELDEHASSLKKEDESRARHIVHENERVQKGIVALKAGDMETMGEQMSRSHASSRDLFGNSCPELDTMSELAEGIDGFLGCRLMGGGFGGSTINLVREGAAESFAEELSRRYEAKMKVKPTMLICTPADGAWSEAV